MKAIYGLYKTPDAAQRAFDGLRAEGLPSAEFRSCLRSLSRNGSLPVMIGDGDALDRCHRRRTGSDSRPIY